MLDPLRLMSDVADLTLADAGRDRIAWADAQMPVLAALRERFAAERPLEGIVVAACLHVTAETANLVRALLAGGAEVALASANPLSTQDDVAAALVVHYGAEVHARRGEDLDSYVEHVGALVARSPRITLDDGADLVSVIHAAHPAVLKNMLGATEETTTGLVRLRALEAEGRLACPVIAVNEALSERVFNDRYGTGQSTLDGVLRATNLLLAGRTVVVLRLRLDRQGHRPARSRHGSDRRRVRGRRAPGARGAHGGLRGPPSADRLRAGRRVHHRHRA